MADIFISYAREDQEKARLLAEALARQGWSVWWDRRIPTGRRFYKVIERELTAARCVIALWSKAASNSSWVREEAQDGLDRDILVPARIETIPLPIGFRTVQTADLSDWNGNPAHLGFTQLVQDIATALGAAAPPEAAQRPPVVGATASSARPLRVFYSYAHEDEELRDELATHLSLLKRQGLILPWHDRKITAGENGKERSTRRLNERTSYYYW